VIFEGWVFKKSKYLGDWRARWFVLTSNFLYSYKEERNYASPTEKISVLSIDKVIDGQQDPGYFTFVIKQNNGQAFNLKTKKAEDRAKWIQEILRIVNKCQGAIEIKDDGNYFE
jgi:hypothetical protein